jgi:glutamate-1-semialdehyde 2,1-aminomutase
VFAGALADAVTEGGLVAVAPSVGPLVGLFVGPPGAELVAPTDYDTAQAIAGNGVYPKLFHAMLRRGVAMAPGAYEVLFPGMAHTERELDLVVEAAGEAAAEVAGELART